MVQIKVGRSHFATVDDCDAEKVSKFTWVVYKKERKDGTFRLYARSSAKHVDGCRGLIKMHRMILPDIREIDHRDGNGLNNKRSNLRPATRSQNTANSPKNSGGKSIYKGVYRGKRGGWQAHCRKDYKRIHIGSFKEEADAAQAYNFVALELHGEFANMNVAGEAAGSPVT